MTIKQQGGIFGRNPTFNDVDVEGDLALSGSISLPNDSISGDAIDGGNATLEGLTVGDTGKSFSSVVIVSSTSGESELRMGDTDTDAGSISYRNNTNIMTFRANAGNRATLDGSGNFEPTGNVVMVSGKGIDFSATSGTGTSELFDDYEEGSWTPVMADAASGGNTAAGGTFVGRYTKVGDLVFITFNGQDIDTTGMTSGNNLYVTGLPYTPATITATNYFTGALALHSVSTTGNNLAVITDGTTYVRFSENVSGGANDWTTVGDLTSGSADIRFSLTYKAA